MHTSRPSHNREMLRLLVVSLLWLVLAALRPGLAFGADAAQHLDELWEQRHQADAVAAAMTFAEERAAAQSNDFAVLWRLARVRWWQARTQRDPARRRALALAAAEAADRARTIEPRRVEGHFLYATAIGEYGETLGVMDALTQGIATKFERAALTAYERDPDFDHGAPALALGRYYYMLPWPLRDLDASRRYLEEVRHRHPQVLLGRVWLAETYLALGEDGLARTELERVASTVPPSADRTHRDDPQRLAAETLRKRFGET